MFFGDMMEMVGGRVISIDVDPIGQPEHKNVLYLKGRSTSTEILTKLRELIKPDDRVMVTLDSDHHRSHVKRELYYYSKFVTKGQYIVVEDIWLWSKRLREFTQNTQGKGGGEAVEWFLRKFKDFKRTDVDKQFPMTISRDGWLIRQ